MKKFIGLFLLCITVVFARPFLPVSTEEAFKAELEADVVVTYTWRENLDIGVEVMSPRNDGSLAGMEHSPRELQHFFKSQKHKKLVVVILDKNTWDDDKIGRIVTEMTQYFFDAGYRRVVIQQGRGSGRGTYSDKTTEPNQRLQTSRL